MQMFLYSLLIIHEKALVALELRNNKGTPSQRSVHLWNNSFCLLFSLLVVSHWCIVQRTLILAAFKSGNNLSIHHNRFHFVAPRLVLSPVRCQRGDMTLIHRYRALGHISHQWNSSKTNGSVRSTAGSNRISNHQKHHKARATKCAV